jgi:glycosyltransferase involved in cell wall biosynthesis
LRLCIFTNHFFPEDFKVNDIAFELVKKDYDITVVTAIPDYPQGKFYDGYSLFRRRKELLNGILIYRLPIIPRRKGRKIEMLLNYASYFLSTIFFTVFYLYKKKYDAIFVHLTSPFFIGLSAVLLKRKQRIPLIFWVLDLWPESLSAAGGIKNKFILTTQIKLVKYVYDNCEKILIGSKGFKNSICEKGNYADKLVYFPNWAEDVKILKNVSEYQQLEPFINFNDNDFIILFAGNIGEAQNLDCILNAAFELKTNKAIKFVFLGDGRRRKHLINQLNDLELSQTVFFPGRYPIDSMPFFMRRADVLLVSLKDEYIFNLTVPAKLQFYMAQRKPVLAVLNGDGAELVNEAQCGIVVSANDTSTLPTAIKRLYEMPEEDRNNMGLNGRKYYEKYFTKEQRIKQLDKIFSKLVTKDTGQIDQTP